VLRFTDHDRTVTFEGYTYAPAQFAGMSAERREGALRTGNQELYGIIDGDSVLVPDLMGSKYRGAEVRHVVTDWNMPSRWIARHRKWIRNVNWNGSTFIATLEGRTQVLHRPAGGRFGGVWQERCPYILGGVHCTKDVSSLELTGASVATVTSRMELEFDTVEWPSAHQASDDFYANGEVEWVWAAPVQAIAVTASPNTTTLFTDATQSWATNEHVGRYLRLLAAGQFYALEWAVITANTATTISYEVGTGPYAITAHPTSAYDICPPSRNAGHVSPILNYRAGTRGVTLLRPTPFPVLVGDSGIIRVGCDGLYGTCVDKFANGVNFGGSPLEPTAARIVEPAADPT
jgi:uncharacterized phage protein (TIGR02218 family)